jgi:hypothetical protein
LRQASEQYLTSLQFLAQLLRHVITRPHTLQSLLGRADLLPLKLLVCVANLPTYCLLGCALSGLLHPGAAPAFGGYLLACKQGATACLVVGFALVQGAVAAQLLCGVLGVFGFVCLGAQSHVAQRFGLGIRFGQWG